MIASPIPMRHGLDDRDRDQRRDQTSVAPRTAVRPRPPPIRSGIGVSRGSWVTDVRAGPR
jgi:hypothetical protein